MNLGAVTGVTIRSQNRFDVTQVIDPLGGSHEPNRDEYRKDSEENLNRKLDNQILIVGAVYHFREVVSPVRRFTYTR